MYAYVIIFIHYLFYVLPIMVLAFHLFPSFSFFVLLVFSYSCIFFLFQTSVQKFHIIFRLFKVKNAVVFAGWSLTYFIRMLVQPMSILKFVSLQNPLSRPNLKKNSLKIIHGRYSTKYNQKQWSEIILSPYL